VRHCRRIAGFQPRTTGLAFSEFRDFAKIFPRLGNGDSPIARILRIEDEEKTARAIVGSFENLAHKGRHDAVLLLTARDALEDRIAGLDGGADDYLVSFPIWR
jgi:hypothetical protein